MYPTAEPHRPERRFHIDQCPKCKRDLTEKDKERLEKYGAWGMLGPSINGKLFKCGKCYIESLHT